MTFMKNKYIDPVLFNTILIEELGGIPTSKENALFLQHVRSAISKTPIEEVIPVVHSKWVYDYKSGSHICLNCNCCSNSESNYCPTCGAKMDVKDADVPSKEEDFNG